MSNILTIGIPTYNRAESILRNIKELMAGKATQLVDLIVIDDGSNDGTFSLINEHVKNQQRVRVLANETNVGYARTFIRLFQACKTPYLMVMTDDDSVIIPKLKPIISYLEKNQPDFVSTQWLQGQHIYRGGPEGSIFPSEFMDASCHAPGLIYRVAACETGLELLALRLNEARTDATVYPQVLLIICLLRAKANCQWLAIPSSREGDAKPSGVRDSSGDVYWSLQSRLKQLSDFEDLFVELLKASDDPPTRIMTEAHRNRVFGMIVATMLKEQPSLRLAFDRSARLFYAKQIIKKLIKYDELSRLVHGL